MIDSHISDKAFKDALEVALKAQGLNKKERQETTNIYIEKYPIEHRNDILDDEEQKAREYQATKKASKKIRSEFEEQCEFVHWFKKTYPGVVIMSIRNGGSRTPRERSDQMREGLHPGAADLYIPAWHLWMSLRRLRVELLVRSRKHLLIM